MDQQRRTRRVRHRGRRTRRQRGGAISNLQEWFQAVKADRALRSGKDYILGDLKQSALTLPIPTAKTLPGDLKELQASPLFTIESYGDIRFFLLSISNYPYFQALKEKANDIKNFTQVAQSDSEDITAQHEELTAFENALRRGAGDQDIKLFDTATYPHYLWYLYENINMDNPDIQQLIGLPIAETITIPAELLEQIQSTVSAPVTPSVPVAPVTLSVQAE